MEQKILKVGDVIEFEGKKYRAEPEVEKSTCVGCAFGAVLPCPVLEECDRSDIILREVKETSRRHIELGVVNVEGDKVTFRIVEQTHRSGGFCQQPDLDIFKASNGVELASVCSPVWSSSSLRLYCRGRACVKDNTELNCTAVDFAKISEAILEYNSTNGKSYEKPWPQTGDEYFQIASNGEIGRDIFRGGDWDTGLQNFGNLFRTYEEAVAAADKIKALLKELAAK